MGKKKPKKTNSNASTSLNASNKEFSVEEQSFQSDVVENSGNLYPFKVLLCQNTDEKDKYLSWIKGCSWRNIAFIHPSVLKNLHCCPYLLIQGKNTNSIFMPYRLKSVKKSSVILLEGMGFEHEESVMVSFFENEGYEADEVSLVSPLELEMDDNMRDLLRKKLSNRFFWPGFKFYLQLFEIKYEFTVRDIKSSGRILFRPGVKKAECLEEVFDCEVSLNATCCSKNESESHLSSMLSSMSLQDTEEPLNTPKIMLNSSQSVIPAFYMMSYRTSITHCDETVRRENANLFKNIGGFKEQIQKIKIYVDDFLNAAENTLGRPRLLLLVGLPGTGKTTMLKAISNEYDVFAEEIAHYLYCKESSEAIKEIREKFQNAAKRTPSFLLLDDLDRLCPSDTEFPYSFITSTLHNLISTCDKSILTLASAVNASSCDKKLMNCFSIQEIEFALPLTLEREEIIEKILTQMNHDLTFSQIRECAEFSQGLTAKEIHNILKYDASLLSLIRMRNTSSSTIETSERILKYCDVKTAIKKKKTHIMSSSQKTKKVRWCDIGGMDVIKEKLKEEMELSQMCLENAKKYNYSPTKGILLYGPPGCSKTMIAKALATECNWNFISKKSSDILNMYVGESERAITNLFLEARVRSPCIIFLDEIDALAADRTSSASASGVGNRIVNTLLTEMAGIEALKNVMVIAATNRPDIVDAALLRRGRIDHHIYVPLPDTEARKEIFKLSMKKRCVADDVDFNYLIEKTEGYSGAEIVQLCNEAAMQLLIEDPECKSPLFCRKHFELALLAVPPRTSKEAIQFYEDFSLR